MDANVHFFNSPSSRHRSVSVSVSLHYTDAFYPRDAILARVLAMSLCLSVCPSVCVCHKSVFHQKEWERINLVFGMEVFSTSPTMF